MSAADRIPAADPEPADRSIRAARGQSVVLLSPNLVLPGSEAEAEAYVMHNAGMATHVIGHRPGRPEELQPGWRGAWDGNLEGWERGRPWWWNFRPIGGVGSLAGAQVDMAAYDRHWQAGQDAAEASRAAHGGH